MPSKRLEEVVEVDKEDREKFMRNRFVLRIKQFGITLLVTFLMVFLGTVLFSNESWDIILIMSLCLTMVISILEIIIIFGAGGLDDSIEADSKFKKTYYEKVKNE